MSLSEGFYDALGHTIKVARTDLGIERAELAEKAGISYSYLAAIENGQKQPSTEVLLKLAEALGLRSHELLESAENRRDRTMAGTDEYPAWLSGKPARAQQSLRVPVATMQARRAEGPWGSAPPPIEDFMAEMARLAEGLSEKDRRVLVELARRLSGR